MSESIVLCVDDEKEILRMYENLFSTMGINVLTAENGTDAIDIMENNENIKLCFTDINLPDMSGLDVTKRIREINENVVVYSISGQGNNAMTESDKELFDGHFFKPTRLMELVATAKQVLGI